MIKAINTRYKGYNFRSRLEARWAVFLDTLGWSWGYEVQGYDLGVGGQGWYLPDFELKDSRLWLEVKPVRHEWVVGEAVKYNALVAAGNAQFGGQEVCSLILVEGDPLEHTAHIFEGGVDFTASDNCFGQRTYTREFRHAANCARAARFEHGQNGA